MRVAPAISLSVEHRKTLESWSRGRRTPARLVQRARIILLAADGSENIEIASEVGVDRGAVGRWRTRFAKDGLAGIERDRPGRGRKRGGDHRNRERRGGAAVVGTEITRCKRVIRRGCLVGVIMSARGGVRGRVER